MATTTTTEVVRVEAGHADLLAEFYRRVWDAQATPERVLSARAAAAAHNPHGAGTEVPTFLFLHKGEAVGHVTTIPVVLCSEERSYAVHWIKGLMVLPEHRNGPIGFLLLRAALQQLDYALAAVVADDARRLFGAVKFRDLGRLANRVRLLKSGAVLNKLAGGTVLGGRAQKALRWGARLGVLGVAGPVIDLGMSAFAGLRGHAATHRTSDEPIGFDELQRLWFEMSRQVSVCSSRDADFLARRYNQTGDYRWITVRDGHRLSGWAAVRLPRTTGDPRMNGVRIATLSDVVAAPTDQHALRALLRASERAALVAGADALLCSASHPALLDVLHRRAYLPYPGNVHVMVRETTEVPLQRFSLDDWWFTRGDSAADEVF